MSKKQIFFSFFVKKYQKRLDAVAQIRYNHYTK